MFWSTAIYQSFPAPIQILSVLKKNTPFSTPEAEGMSAPLGTFNALKEANLKDIQGSLQC